MNKICVCLWEIYKWSRKKEGGKEQYKKAAILGLALVTPFILIAFLRFESLLDAVGTLMPLILRSVGVCSFVTGAYFLTRKVSLVECSICISCIILPVMMLLITKSGIFPCMMAFLLLTLASILTVVLGHAISKGLSGNF